MLARYPCRRLHGMDVHAYDSGSIDIRGLHETIGAIRDAIVSVACGDTGSVTVDDWPTRQTCYGAVKRRYLRSAYVLGP